jgi:glycosyltransferase involved in cell wall biosynthesis
MSAHAPPLVSIVITAYNAERYIGACIDAALAQTWSNIEVVVLDDGSSDRTGEICTARDDSRLHFLKRPRLGRCRALNEAVAAARGTYIAINDADDLSLPHRIEYTLAFLQQHAETAFVGTGFLATGVFHERLPGAMVAAASQQTGVLWPTRAALYRRNLFNNSTLMYPKSTWQRIGGYDESLTNSEDYDFYLRAMQCGPVALLPGETVLWYTNPDGFFKQKSKREHLRTLSIIKLRAHRLLGLPFWLRLYHPVWLLGVELTQHYPQLPGVLHAMSKWPRKALLRGPRVRAP